MKLHLPTDLQRVFLLAGAYRPPEETNQRWQWPTGTYFQRRRNYILTRNRNSSNAITYEDKAMPEVRLQVGTKNR